MDLVERSFDAREFNRICNDPGVAPNVTLAVGDAVDVGPLIENPDHVLLMADGGGVLFIAQEVGVYQVHTAFVKPDRATQIKRGAFTGDVSRAAYRWMFTHTIAWNLQTYIPGFNRAATIFAPLAGWQKEFERKEIWPDRDGVKWDVTFWMLRYDDWVRKTPDLMASGRWFHERLDEQLARFGKTEPHHADEDCHDLHVGACVEMIYGGQYEKAEVLYNRWATFAGYGPIKFVSRSPLIFDIGDAVLQITEQDFKVIRCR